MRIKTIVLVFALGVFFCRSAAPADSPDQNWFPFVLSETMDEASPANIGRLVLDAPAGKHGFVKTKQNRFIFEDGTPVKFWGTNLCFSACFPSKRQAKMTADRLAFFGFNAVRLHHMDFFFEPKGIFQDVRQAAENPQRKTTSRLSRRQLDRLDYLIYQLKSRGIYIDMNLLVSRHFTAADGVLDANRLEMAAKPASLFDGRLIELQKKYAQQLLGHTNKYTGLRYSDDPAIALVEITNENSLFNYWTWNKLDKNPLNKETLPDSYLDQLDELWNSWLKQKYGTAEAVKNNLGLQSKGSNPEGYDFERPSNRLKPLYSGDAMADISSFYTFVEKKYFDEMTPYLKETVGVKCPITGVGGPQGPEDISAESESDFIDVHAYWDHPGFPHGWNLNDFRMRLQSALLDKNLGIAKDMAQNIPYVKPLTMTEWNHCYPNPHAYETPVLVAAAALKQNMSGLFQYSYSHDRPVASKMNSINNFFDTISNPQQLLLTSVGGYLFHAGVDVESSVNDGVFVLNSSPVIGASGKLADHPVDVGALHIRSRDDGAFFLYPADGAKLERSKKMVLITVGQIKNKDSYWAADGKFKWGTSPTLLKRLDADISINSISPLHIYALDPSGARSREIPSRFEDGKTLFSIKNADSPWFEIAA